MGNMKFKYRNRQFGCRGYYVDTVGKNEKKIAEYISNQLKQDEMSEQLVLDFQDPFNGELVLDRRWRIGMRSHARPVAFDL